MFRSRRLLDNVALRPFASIGSPWTYAIFRDKEGLTGLRYFVCNTQDAYSIGKQSARTCTAFQDNFAYRGRYFRQFVVYKLIAEEYHVSKIAKLKFLLWTSDSSIITQKLPNTPWSLPKILTLLHTNEKIQVKEFDVTWLNRRGIYKSTKKC